MDAEHVHTARPIPRDKPRISVGSGLWWGKGLGNGTQTQLNYLKVSHSDFRK